MKIKTKGDPGSPLIEPNVVFFCRIIPLPPSLCRRASFVLVATTVFIVVLDMLREIFKPFGDTPESPSSP